MNTPDHLFLYEYIQIALGTALSKRGVDVVYLEDLKRKGVEDSNQLAWAVQNWRCLVTYNVKDFVLLHNAYVHSNRNHWGILVSQQRTVGEALRPVLRVLQQYEQESMKNRLEFF